MLYILGGLDSDYLSLVTNIIGKKRVLGFDKLFTRLRTHDRRQQHIHQYDTPIVQVNYTKIYSHNKPLHLELSMPKQHFSSGSSNSSHNSNPITFNKTCNGKFANTQCYICKKYDHTVAKCYFQYTRSRNNDLSSICAFLHTTTSFDHNYYAYYTESTTMVHGH